MITEIRIEALKLEGEIFKLNCKLDREYRINHYAEMKKILERKIIKRAQYEEVINEFEKQEKLKNMNRRILR